MPAIACPLCLGPTEVDADGGGRCAAGHAFDQHGLAKALQEKADRALWAAIRALEDQDAYARLSGRTQDFPPVPPEYAQAGEHVAVLRSLLRGGVAPSG